MAFAKGAPPSLITSQVLTLGPGILAVTWPWDQVCACRSQGWQKNISPCSANKPCLSTLLPLTLSSPIQAQALEWLPLCMPALCYETCLRACTSSQQAAANTPHASANVPRAGITMHGLRCEHIRTEPFIWASKFIVSGWKWGSESLWPTEPSASFLSQSCC